MKQELISSVFPPHIVQSSTIKRQITKTSQKVTAFTTVCKPLYLICDKPTDHIAQAPLCNSLAFTQKPTLKKKPVFKFQYFQKTG
jgi:hypothetical protein